MSIQILLNGQSLAQKYFLKMLVKLSDWYSVLVLTYPSKDLLTPIRNQKITFNKPPTDIITILMTTHLNSSTLQIKLNKSISFWNRHQSLVFGEMCWSFEDELYGFILGTLQSFTIGSRHCSVSVLVLDEFGQAVLFFIFVSKMADFNQGPVQPLSR